MPTLPHTLVTALTCTALIGCGTHAPDTIESTVIKRTSQSWEGTPYTSYPQGQPEMTLLRIRIPANTDLKWHTHPMPNMGYVVSGQLLVETRDTGKQITLLPGDALSELVGISHRGRTAAQPVELLVFYAGRPGMPLSE